MFFHWITKTSHDWVKAKEENRATEENETEMRGDATCRSCRDSLHCGDLDGSVHMTSELCLNLQSSEIINTRTKTVSYSTYQFSELIHHFSQQEITNVGVPAFSLFLRC